VLAVFLGKAFLVGLTGAVLAAATVAAWGGASAPGAIDAALLGYVVAAAPGVTMIAAWLPALVAAQQDPAAVLREE
jgi:ABC-type antimicrobial peptide transport system permease subunit